MPRLMMWDGQLRPIPKHVAYHPDRNVVTGAMLKRYGAPLGYPEPHFGRHLIAMRKYRVFPKLDKLPPFPPKLDRGHFKGLRIIAEDGKSHGRANGTVMLCDHCNGFRLIVMWPDGNLTRPCFSHLDRNQDGFRIHTTQKGP